MNFSIIIRLQKLTPSPTDTASPPPHTSPPPQSRPSNPQTPSPANQPPPAQRWEGGRGGGYLSPYFASDTTKRSHPATSSDPSNFHRYRKPPRKYSVSTPITALKSANALASALCPGSSCSSASNSVNSRRESHSEGRAWRMASKPSKAICSVRSFLGGERASRSSEERNS